MSPLEIEIMLHYYCRQTDYRDGDFSAETVKGSMEMFTLGGYLDWDKDERRHVITDGGKMYVEHLMHQPLPHRAWFMPETGK